MVIKIKTNQHQHQHQQVSITLLSTNSTLYRFVFAIDPLVYTIILPFPQSTT